MVINKALMTCSFLCNHCPSFSKNRLFIATYRAHEPLFATDSSLINKYQPAHTYKFQNRVMDINTVELATVWKQSF